MRLETLRSKLALTRGGERPVGGLPRVLRPTLRCCLLPCTFADKHCDQRIKQLERGRRKAAALQSAMEPFKRRGALRGTVLANGSEA